MAFRSFAIFSVLVSAALAQTNPYIPPGISTNCSVFLSGLNNDTTLGSCLSPLLTTLAQFNPAANITSLSTSAVTTALGPLCESSTTMCSQTIFASRLAQFYAACSAELTSTPNLSVKTTYDSMYILHPFMQALCAKDDSGNYCATNLSSHALATPQQTDKQALLAHFLYSPVDSGTSPARRDTSNTTSNLAIMPNATTYGSTNLAFLLLEPSSSPSTLCTTCTRNIFTSYITFEYSAPYAPGLNSSLFLYGQIAIYNSIISTCGKSFLNGGVQAAGGLSGGLLGTSGAARVDSQLSAAISAILGIAALVTASF